MGGLLCASQSPLHLLCWHLHCQHHICVRVGTDVPLARHGGQGLLTGSGFSGGICRGACHLWPLPLSAWQGSGTSSQGYSLHLPSTSLEAQNRSSQASTASPRVSSSLEVSTPLLFLPKPAGPLIPSFFLPALPPPSSTGTSQQPTLPWTSILPPSLLARAWELRVLLGSLKAVGVRTENPPMALVATLSQFVHLLLFVDLWLDIKPLNDEF